MRGGLEGTGVGTPRRSSSGAGQEALDKCNQYVVNTFLKLGQVVAEARVLGPGVREKGRVKDFLLSGRVVAEVDEELRAWGKGFPEAGPLVLSIALDTLPSPTPPLASEVSCRMAPPPPQAPQAPGTGPPQRYMVLERWILRFEQGVGSKIGEVVNSSFAKSIFLLVRTVHSSLRLLPAHKTVAQLRCRDASMGLKYRISTTLAPQTNEFNFAAQGPIHEYKFGEVDTPTGRIQVVAQYLAQNPEDVATPCQDAQLTEQRERSISLPTEPPDADFLLAEVNKGSGGGGGGRAWPSPDALPMNHRRHHPRPNSGGGMTSSGEWGQNSRKRPLLSRAETEPQMQVSNQFFEPTLHTIPGSGSIERDPENLQDLLGGRVMSAGTSGPSGTRPYQTPVHGHHSDVSRPGDSGRSPRPPIHPITGQLRASPSGSPLMSVPRSASIDPPVLNLGTSPSPRNGGGMDFAGSSSRSNPLSIPSRGSFKSGAGVSPQNSPMDGAPFAWGGRTGTSPQQPLLLGSIPVLLAELRRESESLADSPSWNSGSRGIAGIGGAVASASFRHSADGGVQGPTGDGEPEQKLGEEAEKELPPFAFANKEKASDYEALAEIVRKCEKAPALALMGEDLTTSHKSIVDIDDCTIYGAPPGAQVTVGDLVGDMRQMQLIISELNGRERRT